MLATHRRELAPALALLILLVIVAMIAPQFFAAGNIRDLALNNASVLVVATGMTLVILVGEIDISVGSQFAVGSVLLALSAKAGVPVLLLPLVAVLLGAVMGAVNGVLVGAFGLPSIITTLAMMVTWRDGLRWSTEGAWVQGLPPGFQWFGLDQGVAMALIVGSALAVLFASWYALRHFAAGRALFATGANAEAARLAGIDPARVKLFVFSAMGMLTGIAALLNAVRFDAVPGTSGVGLELKAIAAVVVGGAAITGGRASLVGTLVGVVLLGTIGPALTFVGINPFWEKALQGTIILVALGSDTLLDRISTKSARVAAARSVVR